MPLKNSVTVTTCWQLFKIVSEVRQIFFPQPCSPQFWGSNKKRRAFPIMKLNSLAFISKSKAFTIWYQTSPLLRAFFFTWIYKLFCRCNYNSQWQNTRLTYVKKSVFTLHSMEIHMPKRNHKNAHSQIQCD